MFWWTFNTSTRSITNDFYWNQYDVHVLINRVDLTPKNVFVFTNIKFVKFYKLCNSNVGVFCIRISDDILLWICAIYAVCNQDKKGCNKSIGLSLQNLNHYLTHLLQEKPRKTFLQRKESFPFSSLCTPRLGPQLVTLSGMVWMNAHHFHGLYALTFLSGKKVTFYSGRLGPHLVSMLARMNEDHFPGFIPVCKINLHIYHVCIFAFCSQTLWAVSVMNADHFQSFTWAKYVFVYFVSVYIFVTRNNCLPCSEFHSG